MPDIDLIVSGVLSGLATKQINDVASLDVSNGKIVQAIKDLETTLILARNYFATHIQPIEALDIFKIQSLFKSSNWIPNSEGRQFIRVFSPVSLPLSVASLLGSFVLTIPASTWTPLDLPDGTSYFLDTTASVTQAQIYIRLTNDKPSY